MCEKNMMICKKKLKVIIINKYVNITKEILISQKEFTATNYKRLQKALVYIESNLTVDTFTEINNIITNANTITL